MKKISFRGKKKLFKVLAILGFAVAAAAIIAGLVFLYLQRYVVYTGDGARLELPASISRTPGTTFTPVDDVPLPEPILQTTAPATPEPEPALAPRPVSQKKTARYLTVSQLLSDEPLDSDVLFIRIKNEIGTLYYSSDAFPEMRSKADIDNDALRKKLSLLKSRGTYLVACISCYDDEYTAAVHPEYTLKDGDGSIYRDSKGSAWLAPSSNEVNSYLIEIAAELSKFDFDEILLYNFSFPTDTASIFSESVTGLEDEPEADSAPRDVAEQFGTAQDRASALSAAGKLICDSIHDLGLRCSVIAGSADLENTPLANFTLYFDTFYLVGDVDAVQERISDADISERVTFVDRANIPGSYMLISP